MTDAIKPAKKTRPVKKSATKTALKDAAKSKKNRAAAFVNWSVPTKKVDENGEVIYMDSNRGFAIFDEGKYVDAKEVLLVKGAEKVGGVLVLKNVTLTIRLNSPEAELFTEDDFL